MERITSVKRELLCMILVFILAITGTVAQPAAPSDLEFDELREWLRDNWYKSYYGVQTNDRFKNKVYSDPYRDARREMYNFIDNDQNEVEGVYSGYRVSWDFGGTGSNPQPINAEHIVPQSFFRPNGQNDASEPMRSDLHHLFPTFGSWNSTRSNHPFDDIPDDQTSKWMILNNDQSSTPSSNIDGYSEFSSSGGYSRFEPREIHKGNVARAIFYFYTMYENDRDVTEEIESVGNIDLLIKWHEQDPVDQTEMDRNGEISNYQGNRNPFIDYPELASIAWVEKEPVVSSIEVTDISSEVSLYPNPTSQRIHITTKGDIIRSIKISDGQGRIVRTIDHTTSTKTLDLSFLKQGLYTMIILTDKGAAVKRIIKNY